MNFLLLMSSTVYACLSASSQSMAGFLPGYDTLLSDASKKRYSDKLNLMDGVDPYEVAKHEWKDDVDLWPAVTNVACT